MEENTSTENNNTESAKNIETAKVKIEAILKEHNVVLIPIVVHQGDRTFSRIDIAPVQEAAEA
jgi:hypothetical protein